MNLHELKNQVPETPKAFSEMVKGEVARQEGTNILELAEKRQAMNSKKQNRKVNIKE